MEDVVDQTGRTFVVTGANSGIGLETAAALAGAGGRVIMTVRSEEKGETAVAGIEARVGGGNLDVEIVLMDLASLESVRRAAAEIADLTRSVDVLVNNAGALVEKRELTQDGYELTFGANHLGPFRFTVELKPLLTSARKARVVNVASLAHRGAALDLDDLQTERRRYDALRVYGQSKLANLLHARELAHRWRSDGVAAFAVHPGLVRSAFSRGERYSTARRMAMSASRVINVSPAVGASASLYCATTPGLEDRSGGYFQKRIVGNYGPVVEAKPSAAARDAEVAAGLWSISEQLTA